MRSQDQTQKKTDDTEHKSSDKCLPEAGNMKSPDEVGRHREEKGVYEQGEQPESENGHRQGEKNQNRPQEGIEKPQNDGCDEDCQPVIKSDPGHDMGNDEKRRTVDYPFYEQLFHILLRR